MSWTKLQVAIDEAWEARDTISPVTHGAARKAIEETLAALDCGEFRVAEKTGGEWHTHQWIKKAVLLSFRLNPMAPIAGGPGGAHWYDKVPSKFEKWSVEEFANAGFRAVPSAIVRHSAHIGRNAVRVAPCGD